MNYKNIMEIAGVLDCDLIEVSLAKALLLKDLLPLTFHEQNALVYVQVQDQPGWILPTTTEVAAIQRSITKLASQGEELLVPPSLLDIRYLPTHRDFTFVGKTKDIGDLEHAPVYSTFSKNPAKYRTVPLYSDGYDPVNLSIALLDWFKETSLSEVDQELVEKLIFERPSFADILGFRGLVLQETSTEEDEEPVWEPRGLILTAQLSKRRWGVLYRLGVDSEYLTACAANSYFLTEFDNGCSHGDASLHFKKSRITTRMVPLYVSTGKLSQS